MKKGFRRNRIILDTQASAIANNILGNKAWF